MNILIYDCTIKQNLPNNLEPKCYLCLNTLIKIEEEKLISKFCGLTHQKIKTCIKIRENYKVCICATDREAPTNKYFKYIARNLLEITNLAISEIDHQVKEIYQSWEKNFNRLTHNIITLNKKALDSLNLLVDDMDLSFSIDKVRYIQDKLGLNNNKAAEVLKIRKALTLLKNETTVFNILKGEKEILSIVHHTVFKLIQIASSYFSNDLSESGIIIDFSHNHDKVNVDYTSIMAAFIHFWGNLVKYVRPQTKVKIDYSSKIPNFLDIRFYMDSIYIYPDEKEKIYLEGYSGEECKKARLDGSGIGLFAIKRIVQLNNGEFFFIPNVEYVEFNGIKYSNNIAVFRLPLY